MEAAEFVQCFIEVLSLQCWIMFVLQLVERLLPIDMLSLHLAVLVSVLV